MKPWLIWSNEHNAYWGRNGIGYVTKMEDAGRFGTDDAQKTCHEANAHLLSTDLPNEIVVPAPELIMSIRFMEKLL